MEHTHTNKIIYLTIGVVVAIIVVLGVVAFFSKKGAGPDGGAGGQKTLEERMTAEGGSNIPVEERAQIQAEMSTKSKNRLSPAEQEKLQRAMSSQ